MLEIRHLPDLVPYARGLELQTDLAAQVLTGEAPETILLLQHPPVYTIGRQRDQSSLRNPESLPHPVEIVGRGGQATYHGPGQLVGYLMLDLRERGRDLHLHLRTIESALIAACTAIGVPATRRQGLTGVWTESGKLASIGVGVKKWVSLHGFALNVTRECLPGFLAITPCGISGVKVVCLEDEVVGGVDVETVARATAAAFRDAF